MFLIRKFMEEFSDEEKNSLSSGNSKRFERAFWKREEEKPKKHLKFLGRMCEEDLDI
jgi:hypothetical protein